MQQDHDDDYETDTHDDLMQFAWGLAMVSLVLCAVFGLLSIIGAVK